ncbi:motility associated factor glycosyltransferase family protein [Domibacillus iocasae]|uniref:6-hydroxymethylpterin diphosphokinase MptE-like domain-containing protein n=1 Tax=Domibacillus iocasae TaxID=1714016 RepID=A0A1E7DSI7_9BACI|nr:6-hydroxymethylpterin diphosphokinase MptE-like protein [Domibacillus iocasae]OES46053.1 hypothetical protein BA724_15810 [Domibacillus iocasae]
MKFTIIETRTAPTIQVEINEQNRVFHSKYDPLKEAETWANKALEEVEVNDPILVFGIGAGHHIMKLAEALPKQTIHVVELNSKYEQWFRTTSFYETIRSFENVRFQPIKEAASFLTRIHQNNVLIQKTAMDIVPEEFESIKEMLKDFQIQKDSIKNQIDNMTTNFKKNVRLQDPGIGELKDKYRGKKMILVSAGPSLDKQLPLLKQIHDEKEIIIASVGTAVKPLLKSGITPDFFMVIDPNEPTMHQLEGINLPNTPLFYLSTAYHNTILLHKGPRRIVWQNGFQKAHLPADERNDPLMETGGSVATALLDTMVFLGGEQIALVGQDLAFTNSMSHASNTAAGRKVEGTVMVTKSYNQIDKVPTSKNLTIYRKWFERYAKKKPLNLKLYNCTEGGAYIDGWEHVKLSTFQHLTKK